MLAASLDQAVASQFVKVRRVGSADGSSRFRVENGLPLTIASLTLDASEDGGALVPFDAIGLSPLRSGEVLVPSDAVRIESVSFNGL